MVETFFTEKRIIKKIIIAIVVVFMFNFTFTYLGNNVVFAETETDTGEALSDEEMEEEGGGKLLLPLHSLLIFIADAALEVMQRSFKADLPVTITATADSEKEISGAAIAGIVIGVVALAVACVVTYGAAAGIAGAVGTATAGATGAIATAGAAAVGLATGLSTYGGVLVGGVFFAAGSVAGIVYSGDKFIDGIKGEYELPTIHYTPEEIFSNRIPMFDINFFNPTDDKTVEMEKAVSYNAKIIVEKKFDLEDFPNLTSQSKYYNKDTKKYDFNSFETDYHNYYSKMYTKIDDYLDKIGAADVDDQDITTIIISYQNKIREDNTEGIALISYDQIEYYFYELDKKDKDGYNSVIDNVNKIVKNIEKLLYDVSHHELTVEQADKINNCKDLEGIWKAELVKDAVTTVYKSSSKILQDKVANIYYTLRKVAIVALLSILIYVGIRMVLSSASKDKAKYKQMLLDWLVAFVMLFVLHYIMAFIIDISESLTNICNNSNIENVPIMIPDGTRLKADDGGYSGRLDGGDDGSDVWGTNYIGAIRFYAGLVQKRGYTMKGIMYTIMYLVLVIYTVMFTFQYLKRVLYMAFLTMIAPLVAITYPLDKINDGKAQGFNMWLREYIFNALLQPIHFIIYVTIMGSVMALVVEYPVYGVVALGFMIPAEKFIRKMFGFEKASTVGAFGGAAGAAMLMSGVQRLTHRPHKKGDSNNEGKGDINNQLGKIRSIGAMPEKKEGKGIGTKLTEGAGNAIIPGAGTVATKIGEQASNIAQQISGINQGENKGLEWDSRLNQEQKDELIAEGIAPGDQEYRLALSNYGIRGEDPANKASEEVETIPYEKPNVIEDRPVNNAEKPQSEEKTNIFNRVRTGLRPMGEGIKAVGGHYTRRLENNLRRSHPLRSIRRGITYGAGALTLGAVGLAAGIASGDASKALQYTGAGAMAGGNLGKNLGETASNVVGLEGAAKSFKAGALGDKNSDIERAKYKRDFKRNVSNYDAGVRNVTAKGWKEMSKDGGIIDTGLDYGINNIDDLSNIYKTQQKFMEDNNMSAEEAQDLAFKAYKLDSQFGDYNSNSKTQENLDRLLISRGYEGEEKERVKEGMLNTMGTYQKVALDDQIKEPVFDYTRMADTEKGTQSKEREDNVQQPPVMPVAPTEKESQEEKARRANAESDANKLKEKEKAEKARMQEEIDQMRRQKNKENIARAKASREKSKKKNNVENGEQGSEVKEFESKKSLKIKKAEFNFNDQEGNVDPIQRK